MRRHVLLEALFLLVGHVTAFAQPGAFLGRTFAGSPAFLYDADGAVGPGHYAEITNNGFRVTDLSTGSVAYSSVSLAQFWGSRVRLPLLPGCCYDPHLEYDHASQRWFAVSLGGQNRPDSAVYVGVSETADPSQNWNGLVIDADASDLRWADFPYLGLDGSAIYITVSMPGIASTTPAGLALLVLPKADVTGPAPTAARLSRFLTTFNTTRVNDFYATANPQIDYLGTASDGLFTAWAPYTVVSVAAGYRWATGAVHQRMNGQGSGPATLLPWARTPPYQFDDATNPPPQLLPTDAARQPGTPFRLNNGGGNSDVRIGDALYSVASGPVQGRLGIIWKIFQPSTNTIVNAGFIGDNVHDYLSPSIAANARGDIVIAYARTGPTEYASFYCSVGRRDETGQLTFGAPMLVKAGSDIYDDRGPIKDPGRARFIDYASSVSVHPSNHARFWISGPYVSRRNTGSTWIAEVVLPPPQTLTGGESITSVLGTSRLTYQLDGNVVITDVRTGRPVWATNTTGTPGSLVMQGDGNLVVYGADGVPRWASGTSGNRGAHFELSDAGKIVIYNAAGQNIWTS